MLNRLVTRTRVIVKSATNRNLDPLDRLSREHMMVDLTYLQIRGTRDYRRKRELFGRIYEMLQNHTRLEESSIYPLCQEHAEVQSLVKDAFEEHGEIKDLLAEIHTLPERANSERRFNELMRALMNTVQHHVREEEDKLFPWIRKNLSVRQVEQAFSGAPSRARKRRKGTKAA